MSTMTEMLEKLRNNEVSVEDVKAYLKGKDEAVKVQENEQDYGVEKVTEPKHSKGKLFKVIVSSHDGDKVNVKIPLELAKMALRFKPDALNKYTNEKDIDLEALMEMIDSNLSGELVNVESADGDIVRIVIE